MALENIDFDQQTSTNRNEANKESLPQTVCLLGIIRFTVFFINRDILVTQQQATENQMYCFSKK